MTWHFTYVLNPGLSSLPKIHLPQHQQHHAEDYPPTEFGLEVGAAASCSASRDVCALPRARTPHLWPSIHQCAPANTELPVPRSHLLSFRLGMVRIAPHRLIRLAQPTEAIMTIIEDLSLENGVYDPSPSILGTPKRAIALDSDTEKRVQKAVDTLDESGFTIQDLFEIFNEWKSRATISARRVILSIGTVIGGAHLVDVDMSDATILGLTLGDANPIIFLLLVAVVLVGSGTTYVLYRRLDSHVREALIARTLDRLSPCREAKRALDAVVKEKELDSVEKLIDDFTGPELNPPTTLDAYDATQFYEDKLMSAHTARKWMDLAEFLIVLGVAGYTLYAIVCLSAAATL